MGGEHVCGCIGHGFSKWVRLIGCIDFRNTHFFCVFVFVFVFVFLFFVLFFVTGFLTRARQEGGC